MDFIPFIKELGRGATGSRSLSEGAADELFSAMLAGDVPPMEMGALLIALRMKGESFDEMSGFLIAASRRHTPLARPPNGALRPIVVPSYNGARRGANLTALLAILLAKVGLPVLVHGPRAVAGRVGTLELLRALGCYVEWTPEYSFSEALSRSWPVIAETPVLFPELETLMSARKRLGVRNAAHSLVKIIDPFGGEGVVLSAATHPPYLDLAARLTQRLEGRALVFRATEGEPYFNPKRCPSVIWVNGRTLTPLIAAEMDSLTDLPDLPADGGLEQTILWTNEVLTGRRPIPSPILDQLACAWLAADGSQSLDEARMVIARKLAGECP